MESLSCDLRRRGYMRQDFLAAWKHLPILNFHKIGSNVVQVPSRSVGHVSIISWILPPGTQRGDKIIESTKHQIREPMCIMLEFLIELVQMKDDKGRKRLELEHSV